jgi:3-polyprenyl-4-hydroxybenzoate decarboxylase
MQWLKDVPETEEDLIKMDKDKEIAVFYTIWSYAPGAGANLLRQAADWLLKDYKDLKGIVTLSPQTPMARRFHLKNGAKIRKENATTVNYEYYFKE